MLKAFQGAGFKFDAPGKVLVSLSDSHKEEVLPLIYELKRLGFDFMASEGTSSFLAGKGVENEPIDIKDSWMSRRG